MAICMYIVVPTLYELQSTPLCYNNACIRSIKTDRDQGHLKQQARPVVVAASQWGMSSNLSVILYVMKEKNKLGSCQIQARVITIFLFQMLDMDSSVSSPGPTYVHKS